MATFEEVLEKFKDMVWLVAIRFAPSFPKGLYDLEDVHQIALLALFNAYEGYDKNLSSFSTYAYTCINNALSLELQKVRAKKRMCPSQPVYLTEQEWDCHAVDDTITPVDELLVDKWAVNEILNRLTELPQTEQKLIYQVCVCGRSIRSVACEAGRPYSSVFKQIEKFKLKMKEELSNEM